MPKKPRAKARAIDMVVPPEPFLLPVPSTYAGDVYIWDLDKTYLRTEFASLREIVRVLFQKAIDKVAYPGAAALLRALRRGKDGSVRPFYFVSASPPQLHDVIREKFHLDGVEVDGIYFKDNFRNVRPGRFARLREQMGYKLLALLDLRKRLPDAASELCFGDDVETDAAVYALYGQAVRGWVRKNALVELLEKQNVFHDEAVRIAWRARRVPPRPGPSGIYIQMHRTIDPRYYRRYGAQVVGTASYFQTALALFNDKRLDITAVAAVGIEILTRGAASRFDLVEQLDDAVRRRLLGDTLAVSTITELASLDVLPKGMSREPRA